MHSMTALAVTSSRFTSHSYLMVSEYCLSARSMQASCNSRLWNQIDIPVGAGGSRHAENSCTAHGPDASSGTVVVTLCASGIDLEPRFNQKKAQQDRNDVCDRS